MANDLLTQRLDQGPLICAEGFLFELERRGYLSAGEFVPEVALLRPDALEALHREFQHAEAGTEVPAGLAHAVEQIGAQVVRELVELCLGEIADGAAGVHGIEERRGGAGCRYFGKHG